MVQRSSEACNSNFVASNECFETYHRDDIGCHVREAHATRVESANKQLPVLVCVLMLSHIVGFDDFFL